ncbi:MAG: U32 family peptidase, partial [Candidatus Marinimicrobia bacterium]|nr:U32 family peptidase [Candidatus Neomarinimicrobiota bacterium]
RIILPRELRLKEIQEIRDKVPNIDLESFVHGAICIAYSGRCLITNYMNHRDANQGTCTNSCRWEYELESKNPSIINNENRFDNILFLFGLIIGPIIYSFSDNEIVSILTNSIPLLIIGG